MAKDIDMSKVRMRRKENRGTMPIAKLTKLYFDLLKRVDDLEGKKQPAKRTTKKKEVNDGQRELES